MKDSALKAVIQFVRSSHYSKIYSAIPDYDETIPPEVYLAKLPPLTYDSLKTQALSHYAESDIRYIASSFSTDKLEDLVLLPQLRTERSNLIKRCLLESKTPVALFASPMFWQMGPLFYRTCRDAGIPAALVSPRNPPVTRQIITETGVTYVCAPADVARDIYLELEAHQLAEQITLWHIILPLGSSIPEALPSGKTICEYHIFPGVALGEGNANDTVCHVNDNYRVDCIDKKPYISSYTKEAFPLLRYSPPHLIAEQQDSSGQKFIFHHEN